MSLVVELSTPSGHQRPQAGVCIRARIQILVRGDPTNTRRTSVLELLAERAHVGSEEEVEVAELLASGGRQTELNQRCW
jgi:hypothetical protein